MASAAGPESGASARSSADGEPTSARCSAETSTAAAGGERVEAGEAGGSVVAEAEPEEDAAEEGARGATTYTEARFVNTLRRSHGGSVTRPSPGLHACDGECTELSAL